MSILPVLGVSIAMAFGSPLQGEGPTVFVDGNQITFHQAQPMAMSGRTMVPLRGLFEALGAYVEYIPATRQIEIRKGSELIELTVGTKIARKNGSEIVMDVPPVIYKNSTMVPLRFVAEGLGAQVNHVQATNRIEILIRDVAPPPGF
jgi:hypothetical protein